ncbi:MAG: biotin--[acetyl-CoA-carboxylase] ligase, partial [Alphaproteobacteria bacterium]|nr:biotin--[acetyl-CoA-carboxylase] ligase [Alphaproteobacteria bacterium]
MKWQIKHFDTVVSTNEIAKDLSENNVVVASCQTGGHGRYGRVWESPKGNLYLSAVVADFGNKTPLLSFVAGVSVIEALNDFPVLLKWPNDVLLNGKKVAGILLERTNHQTVVIGIGINVASAPDKKMYQTASLENKISLNALTEKILSALENNLLYLSDNRFDIIRKKWINHACGLGQMIEVHLANQTLRGLFKEFSPQGELILETPD